MFSNGPYDLKWSHTASPPRSKSPSRSGSRAVWHSQGSLVLSHQVGGLMVGGGGCSSAPLELASVANRLVEVGRLPEEAADILCHKVTVLGPRQEGCLCH